jgi:hypothetical protein
MPASAGMTSEIAMPAHFSPNHYLNGIGPGLSSRAKPRDLQFDRESVDGGNR